MRHVLEGIRVLDWTMWHVGPSAGAMLADLGAEVIHMEQLGIGDPMRGFESMFGAPLGLPHGRHALFEDLNRGKKGLAIDLRKEGGCELVYRLLDKCDVFITNIRDQVVKRYGLGYETVSRRHPRLIYGHASMYGPKGPDCNKPGLEPSGFARSGIIDASAELGRPPTYVTAGLGDRTGGVFLAYGVLAALLARERFGIGQKVNASQLGGLVTLQAASFITYLLGGQAVGRFSKASVDNPLTNIYQCKDDRWLFFGMVQEERFWAPFCEAIGCPELKTDPRFDTPAKRRQNKAELGAILDSVFATKSATEWVPILNRYDLWFDVVNSIPDACQDAQVLANQYIIDYEHPQLGPVKVMGYPIEMSETPLSMQGPAPELGEHTEQVLLELCGLNWEEIARLREQGAI